MKGIKKRFLCLMLALAMVLGSGCSTITASAVETLDNTAGESMLDVGNEGSGTETNLDNAPAAGGEETPGDTSKTDEGEDEEILDNTPADDGEETLDNTSKTDEGEETLDNTSKTDEETDIEEVPPEEPEDKKEESNSLSFFSSLFRSSDKTLGTGTGTERSTTLQDGTTFVLDKYLSDPTGEMNGQNTYDLYLEQGFFDDTVPDTYEVLAPDESYLYFVIDQSSSMAQDPIIDSLNDSTRSFLEQVLELNNERLTNARNGVYSDIDPNGDVEAQMEDHLIKVAGVIGYNNHVYHHQRGGRGGERPASYQRHQRILRESERGYGHAGGNPYQYGRHHRRAVHQPPRDFG